MLWSGYGFYVQSHCLKRRQYRVTSRSITALLRQRMIENVKYARRRHNVRSPVAKYVISFRVRHFFSSYSADEVRKRGSIQGNLLANNVLPAKLPRVLPCRFRSSGCCIDAGKSFKQTVGRSVGN